MRKQNRLGKKTVESWTIICKLPWLTNRNLCNLSSVQRFQLPGVTCDGWVCCVVCCDVVSVEGNSTAFGEFRF